MTVRDIRQMDHLEFVQWRIYYKRLNQMREQESLKAKHFKKGKR